MNPADYPHAVLLLVSAPSGAGKTTLCQRLLADEPSLRYSVSCTTRPPRPGEKHGEHYFFMERADFDREAASGTFLEHAEVHGHGYGTRADFVERAMEQGHSVLLDVDVQGARKIRDVLAARPADDPLRSRFVDVFLSAPSVTDLRQRLQTRGQDAIEVIERRMANAQREMADAGRYAYQIINGDVEAAYLAFRSIFVASRHRTRGGLAPSP